MRDYFDTLVSRVLQPDQGVQPRPRVPFAGVVAPLLDALESLERDSEREATGRRSWSIATEPDAPRRSRIRAGLTAGTGDNAHSPARARPTRKTAPVIDADGADLADIAFAAHPTVRDTPVVTPRPAPRTPPGLPAASLDDGTPRVKRARTPDDSGRPDVLSPGTEVPPGRPRDPRRGLMTIEEYVRQRDGGRT